MVGLQHGNELGMQWKRPGRPSDIIAIPVSDPHVAELIDALEEAQQNTASVSAAMVAMTARADRLWEALRDVVVFLKTQVPDAEMTPEVQSALDTMIETEPGA